MHFKLLPHHLRAKVRNLVVCETRLQYALSTFNFDRWSAISVYGVHVHVAQKARDTNTSSPCLVQCDNFAAASDDESECVQQG